MAMLQLDPPIPLLVRSGDDAWVKAMAHLVIDPGYEHDLQWTVFTDESRECWTLRNRDVRAQENITAGRKPLPKPSPHFGGPLVVGDV